MSEVQEDWKGAVNRDAYSHPSNGRDQDVIVQDNEYHPMKQEHDSLTLPDPGYHCLEESMDGYEFAHNGSSNASFYWPDAHRDDTLSYDNIYGSGRQDYIDEEDFQDDVAQDQPIGAEDLNDPSHEDEAAQENHEHTDSHDLASNQPIARFI